jgi:hypothetical protein
MWARLWKCSVPTKHQLEYTYIVISDMHFEEYMTLRTEQKNRTCLHVHSCVETIFVAAVSIMEIEVTSF